MCKKQSDGAKTIDTVKSVLDNMIVILSSKTLFFTFSEYPCETQ